MHLKGYTGKNIICAILDTGILSHHPLLKGKIVSSKDFTMEGIEDQNGHGTIVALILLQAAPDCKIMNIKVLDKNGEGKEDDLINGMLWAKDHGADIINISAGIERDCDGSCRVCKTAKSIAKEIPICAAAGNNPKVGSCPAQVGKPVISVGALDYGGKNVADYSYKGIVYMSGTFKMIPLDMQVGLEDEDLLS